MKTKLLLALMAVTVIMIGCGSDDKPADEPTGQPTDKTVDQPLDQPAAPAAPPAAFSQDTPRQTLKAFFSCFEDGDKEKTEVTK